MEPQGCVAMESQLRSQREGWVTCLSASNANSMESGPRRVPAGLLATEGVTLPPNKGVCGGGVSVLSLFSEGENETKQNKKSKSLQNGKLFALCGWQMDGMTRLQGTEGQRPNIHRTPPSGQTHRHSAHLCPGKEGCGERTAFIRPYTSFNPHPWKHSCPVRQWDHFGRALVLRQAYPPVALPAGVPSAGGLGSRLMGLC